MRKLLLFGGLWLTGCTLFQSDVKRGYSENSTWKSEPIGVVYTAADVRMVTARKHPVLENTVMCTEPSPDVAKALSTATAVSASANAAGRGASGAYSSGSAEAIDQLAGRTAGLLALRDGVYRSCEAYANGSLGADVYSLVAGKYTQTLSTLFLAQDMTGAIGGPGAASATSPQVTFPAAPPAGGATDPGASKPANNAASSSSSSSGGGGKPGGGSSSGGGGSSSGGGSSGGSGSSGGGTSSSSSSSGSSSGGSSSSSSGATVTVPSGVGPSLVRMNEDMLDVDYNLPALLLVACMNEYDPTRLQYGWRPDHTQGPLQNSWLRGVCEGMNSIENINKLAANYAQFVKALGHPGLPVDPMPKATVSSPPPPNPTPAPAAVSNVILEAQTALNKAHCGPSVIDGKEGPLTDAAAKCYQKANQLKVTGVLDADTLLALKLIGESK